MPKHKFREIIELAATVANGATDTRTSERIPYPFVLKQIEIHNTSSIQADSILRIGITKGGTEAIASDQNFRDFFSNKSSKEANRYPDSTIRLFPNLHFPQPEYRIKAEMINNSGLVHDYLVVCVIEEERDVS